MLERIQERLAESVVFSPKYRRLSEAIRSAIAHGELHPGARLPTEVQLSHLLPFSLGTIQKAYGQLVKDGHVVRSRGRGSFVAPPRRQMAEPWHCRFLGDDGTVLPVYPRMLGQQSVAPQRRWAALFGNVEVIRIDRNVSINGEFDVLSRFYATSRVARTLLSLPKESVETVNFKTILLHELSMPISRIVQTIAPADQALWSTLRLAGMPYLALEATAYGAEGEVAYFQELFVPANSRKLLFESDLSF